LPNSLSATNKQKHDLKKNNAADKNATTKIDADETTVMKQIAAGGRNMTQWTANAVNLSKKRNAHTAEKNIDATKKIIVAMRKLAPNKLSSSDSFSLAYIHKQLQHFLLRILLI
jgi:hypothetical protein